MNNNFRVRKTSSLVRRWIPTGMPGTPLTCVWVPTGTNEQRPNSANPNDETGGLCL